MEGTLMWCTAFIGWLITMVAIQFINDWENKKSLYLIAFLCVGLMLAISFVGD